MNHFYLWYNSYWFTKLVVASKLDEIDPKCLWDLETRDTAIKYSKFNYDLFAGGNNFKMGLKNCQENHNIYEFKL